MKRIFSFIVFAAVMLSVPITLPVYAADEESGIISLMKELEIMQGDDNGDMELDRAVSRAEFAKIAVAAANAKNAVTFGLKISPYPDVTYDTWFAPYVKAAVEKRYIKGYEDFNFHPYDTVTYEEAVTIMLRVLGYSDSTIQGAYPYGQLSRAEDLDMLDGVEGEIGEELSRRKVMYLVCNALQTETASVSAQSSGSSQAGTSSGSSQTSQGSQTSSSSGGGKLLSAHGCTVIEDVNIISTYSDDKDIGYDNVMTSAGTYKKGSFFDDSSTGMIGKAYIKNSDKLIAFVPDGGNRTSDTYLVYSVVNNNIIAYKNEATTQLDVSDTTRVYKGTTVTTFAAAKSQLELGDRISITRTENGDIDYITYIDGNLLGPLTSIGGNWQSSWSIGSDAEITRDGFSVSAADIRDYDIVYYLPDLNMVMAYSDKVTGIYEKANPNRDVPTSITLSGKDYELEGSAAFNKLYSGGSFEYGDTVTLLLGKDGKAADAISPSNMTSGGVGYLIGTGTKEYSSGAVNTFTNYYIRIVGTDGTAYEYVTDRDYSESVNSVVELSFDNGYARIKKVSDSGTGGTFSWSSRRLGSAKLSPGINILDIGTRDITHTATYCKVYGQRLDGVEISSKSVLYSHKNSSGEIDTLILDNVTNDSFSYGLITKASVASHWVKDKDGGSTEQTSGTYDFMVEGNRYSVTVSGKFSVSRGDVVRISGSMQNPDVMTAINAISGSITSLSSDKLIAGNTTYKLSDRITAYKVEDSSSGEYSMLSLSDVINNFKNYNIRAYYDKSDETGGRVRVLLVSDK